MANTTADTISSLVHRAVAGAYPRVSHEADAGVFAAVARDMGLYTLTLEQRDAVRREWWCAVVEKDIEFS